MKTYTKQQLQTMWVVTQKENTIFYYVSGKVGVKEFAKINKDTFVKRSDYFKDCYGSNYLHNLGILRRNALEQVSVA